MFDIFYEAVAPGLGGTIITITTNVHDGFRAVKSK